LEFGSKSRNGSDTADSAEFTALYDARAPKNSSKAALKYLVIIAPLFFVAGLDVIPYYITSAFGKTYTIAV